MAASFVLGERAQNYYHTLSYGVAVNQWITSRHGNRMITRVITLWRERVTSLTNCVSTMCFLVIIVFILKAIKKSHMINRILHSLSFHNV